MFILITQDIMQKTLFFSNGSSEVSKRISCEIVAEIKDKDGFKALSIRGCYFKGEKLLQSEKNLLGFGQIADEVKNFIPVTLYKVWKRWHLNDMRAGTVKQEQILRKAKDSGIELNSYEDGCNFLAEKDAYIDNGYKYGTRWLREELPQGVIDYIMTL